MLAQVLVAAALAFSPQAPFVAPSAARAPVSATPVVMAGWNDPWDGGRSMQGREKLEVTKNDFDQKMADDAAKMTNMMGAGTLIMVGGCLVVLLPLLATQP